MSLPTSAKRCTLVMVGIGLLLGFLPIMNGLCAGLIGGRFAGSPEQALRCAGVASVPICLVLLAVVVPVAPAVAVPWVLMLVFPLFGGAALGAAIYRTP